MLGRYTTGPGSEQRAYQRGVIRPVRLVRGQEPDHPVRLVTRQVADVAPRDLVERDRRLYRGEGWNRDLGRPRGVVCLRPRSVLLVHGLNDAALLPGMLNNTWEWLDNTLTLVTIPGVGHFVQNDAPDLVSSTISSWLQLPLK